MEYVVRNKSGRITHYLKKTQLITGEWAISTKSFTDRHIPKFWNMMFSR